MLTSSAEWKNLQKHYQDIEDIHMKSLFEQDSERFNKYSMTAAGLTLDYSKNHITEQSIEHLVALAQAANVEQQRERMFAGSEINVTEHRAVLHTALRNFSGQPVYVDGQDVMPEIEQTRAQMKRFVEAVSTGEKKGYSGKAFTDVISIGIGGSFLGPKIMSEALKPYRQKHINVHFVANVDGCHLQDVLAGLNPETTLIITSSKTLTTQETLRNTQSAKEWFLQTATQADVEYNFACVSTNITAAQEFGINPDNIFPMWDWVGGRYSVWSAIGLPLALAIGYENYHEFLTGAFELDQHFQQAPLSQNMPVIMALLGIWYRNFHGAQSQVLLPYYHYLRGLPAYIQQLDMESNGKSVNLKNEEADYDTGPIIWGSEGTNGQHSFHQLIHQSKTHIPVDFMMPLHPASECANHHDMLAANCFGQSQALMEGQSEAQVIAAMKKAKCSTEEIKNLSSHKVMKGNKPSNTLLFDRLDPKTLGSLIALYEQKVFVQGVIWQINSFDQWGVELGKALGNQVLSKLADTNAELTMDGSTNGLISLYRARK
ncbi:glucose-6-phosphate isomerase [Thalassotalea euphylliae]|uniref:Glucose-6-phosphate isomerase n=1 Tax=Thalassotalea euphylliae TaxID=1655234 RepID=A0A3E0UK02_9GAMM|nr:glucose-6-phosphate isomerase [Thalassotalea euphylliae]REL37210.1 glucose-6-phosphate isomerase [Thalassotalea euphylliae]